MGQRRSFNGNRTPPQQAAFPPVTQRDVNPPVVVNVYEYASNEYKLDPNQHHDLPYVSYLIRQAIRENMCKSHHKSIVLFKNLSYVVTLIHFCTLQ